MRWPEVPEDKHEQIGELTTEIIHAWEENQKFKKYRYFSNKKGFGGFSPDFPASIEFILSQYKKNHGKDPIYSIIKINFEEKECYSLCVCEGVKPWAQANTGGFGLYEVVQLLKRNESGNYTVTPKYFGVKIISPKYKKCTDFLEKKRVARYAEKVISAWEKNPICQENNFFSKLYGFGDLNKPVFPNNLSSDDKDYSICRIMHDNQYYYGLWVSEGIHTDTVIENDKNINYGKIQLLVEKERKYFVSDCYYGIRIVEGMVMGSNYIHTKPSENEIAEAQIIKKRKLGGDLFTINGYTIIAIRPCPGFNLAHYKEQKFRQMTPILMMKKFLDIASGICDDIKELHAANIIHRDIKPDNILFDGRRVKIIDYGLAKEKKDNGHLLLNGHAGTPEYFPLFQCTLYKINSKQSLPDAQELEFNAETDYESLGRTLYSIILLMHDCYFKRRVQIILISLLIFSNSPEIETFKSVLPDLNNIKKDLEWISKVKTNAEKSYNKIFNVYFNRFCESKSAYLLEMGCSDYQKTNQCGGNARRTSYWDTEFSTATSGRVNLQTNLEKACIETAIALLHDYASLWTMIFCFHWRRHNRHLVNSFLAKFNSNALTLDKIVGWARATIFENEQINQSGSLARRCRFICALSLGSIKEDDLSSSFSQDDLSIIEQSP